MTPPPPRSTRTDTLFPYTSLFRSLLIMAAFAEYGAQRIDLGLVADAGAGAVRLDQVDRHRVDAAALVGAAHGQQFALEAWREQTLGATVGQIGRAHV